MNDFEKEAAKIAEEISKEKQFDLIKVYFRCYNFPEEKELLHVELLTDFENFIKDPKKKADFISLLKATIKSLEKL